MRVALITEGTYPHTRGGVSVWCDQLIRGMDEHRFELHAIVATGSEPQQWTLPPNVDDVVITPLWGASVRPVSNRMVRRTFPPAFARFLDSMDRGGSAAAMTESLHELFLFAQRGQLTGGLLTDDSVDQMINHFGRIGEFGRPVPAESPRPTIYGAVLAVQLLEHYLRPLGAPVPAADLCHSAANGLGTLIALAAKWKRDTPFLLTEHGIYLRERLLANGPGTLPHSTRQVIISFIRRLTQSGYLSADGVAPGSDYNLRWERAEGVPVEAITRIHNGVDPDLFSSSVEEPAEPVVTWIGRINPLKDLKTLLRTFARVVNEIPEARLRIFGVAPAGDEAYRDECKALVTHLQLEGCVTFEGRVGDAAAAYYAGQVVMLTSISEGFPYTVIEAMACGRPVVATDVGGVSEAVVDPSLLAAARDDEALAEICVRLLRDAELRRSLGVVGRRLVIDHFTVQSCVRRHVRLYGELTDESVSRTSAMSPGRADEVDGATAGIERVAS